MILLIMAVLLGGIAFHQVAADRKHQARNNTAERHEAAEKAAVAAVVVVVAGVMFGVELHNAGIPTMSAPITVLSVLMVLNLKEHIEDFEEPYSIE